MSEAKKSCRFVKTPDGKHYLPRPSSWMAGWARHLWFQHNVGSSPSIASPEFFEKLVEDNGFCDLIEHDNGMIEISYPPEK